MGYLFLSIAVLLVGPALYSLLARKRQFLEALDGFVFIAVGGLVLLHLQPSFQSEYFFSILFVTLLGFLGPNLFENLFRKAHSAIHQATLYLGVAGLVVHSLFDGTGLSAPQSLLNTPESNYLPLAIVVHRVPVVLTLWWLARPRFPLPFCWFLLALMGVATTAGFFIGKDLTLYLSPLAIEYVQAFVAGMILHVVFFRFHFDTPQQQSAPLVQIGKSVPPRRTRFFHSPYETAGNFFGLLLLVVLIFLETDPFAADHHHHHHQHHHHHSHSVSALGDSFFEIFYGLAIQTAPALLLAYLVAIFLFGFLPPTRMRWLTKGPPLMQSFKGVATGLPLPVCSCGILPFYQTLVKRGAPPAAAVSFLVATPELGIDALLISLPLLGADLTIIRVVAAAFLAFFVSLIMARYITPRAVQDEEESSSKTAFERLKDGTKFSLVELVDSTAPWILLGLVLAAFAEPLLDDLPLSLPYQLEIVVFGLIGVVVYVCASGATPLVSVFIASGVSPGAGITFLLTGPATNISTFGVLSELHGRKIALLFAVLTSATAIAIGYGVNLFEPFLTLKSGEELTGHSHSSLGLISIVCISLLYLFSLARQGGRAFLSEITPR